MNKKNTVIIVNQDCGYLTIDVANSLEERFNVIIFTGKLNQSIRKLNYKVKLVYSIKYLRKSLFLRLFSWLFFFFHLGFLLLFKFRKCHIIFYTNPPISYFWGLFLKNYSIVIFDIYPNSLELFKISEKNLIYKYWNVINKKVFSNSINIITLTDSMKEIISNNNVDKNKIKVVPLWSSFTETDLEKITQFEHDTLEKKFKSLLINSFLITYAGNMGYGHSLKFLIKIANNLRDPLIKFVLLGSGPKTYELMKMVQKLNLHNLIFFDKRPYNEFIFILLKSKLAVVSQEKTASLYSIPSKTFNYLTAGLPLIAIGSYGSELEKLVNENNLGIFVGDDNLTLPVENFIKKCYFNNQYYLKLKSNVINLSHKFNYKLAQNYFN